MKLIDEPISLIPIILVLVRKENGRPAVLNGTGHWISFMTGLGENNY